LHERASRPGRDDARVDASTMRQTDLAHLLHGSLVDHRSMGPTSRNAKEAPVFKTAAIGH
jgi:hypothetical protein